MPNPKPSSQEPNWYKIATIALTVATVAITFISGIYYKRVENSQHAEDRFDKKIQQLSDRKEAVAKIPIVEVSLLTLEKAGLPESAFIGLPRVPSVIQITHKGGETAKGITVSILAASANIVAFEPDSSIDEYTNTISADGRRLTINVPQLRRGSTVQGVIKADKVTSWSYEASSDTGQISKEGDKNKAELDVDFRLYGLDDLDKLDPNVLESPKKIDQLIEAVRLSKERIRSGDLGDYIPSYLEPFIGALVGGFVFFLGWLGFDYIRGLKHYKLGTLIENSKNSNVLKVGISTEKVKEIFGVPTHMITKTNQANGTTKIWSYIPKGTITHGPQPDIVITFKNDLIESYEYVDYK